MDPDIIEASKVPEPTERATDQVQRVCENPRCGDKFFALRIDIERGRGRCCSRKCAAALGGKVSTMRNNQAGASNNNYRGGPKPRVKTEAQIAARNKGILAYSMKRKWIPMFSRCGICGLDGAQPHIRNPQFPLDFTWVCPEGLGCQK